MVQLYKDGPAFYPAYYELLSSIAKFCNIHKTLEHIIGLPMLLLKTMEFREINIACIFCYTKHVSQKSFYLCGRVTARIRHTAL